MFTKPGSVPEFCGNTNTLLHIVSGLCVMTHDITLDCIHNICSYVMLVYSA